MITFNESDKLQIVTSSTADLSVHVSYSDLITITSGDLPQVKTTSGSSLNIFTDIDTFDIAGMPDGDGVRAVQRISIVNTHTSAANTIYIKLDTGKRLSPPVSLLAGEMYEYENMNGWRKVNALGKSYS